MDGVSNRLRLRPPPRGSPSLPSRFRLRHLRHCSVPAIPSESMATMALGYRRSPERILLMLRPSVRSRRFRPGSTTKGRPCRVRSSAAPGRVRVLQTTGVVPQARGQHAGRTGPLWDAAQRWLGCDQVPSPGQTRSPDQTSTGSTNRGQTPPPGNHPAHTSAAHGQPSQEESPQTPPGRKGPP